MLMCSCPSFECLTCSWHVAVPSVFGTNDAVHTSAGVTGITLAMAGARTTLSDLPHITPLTRRNLDTNFGADQSYAQVTAASAVLPWALHACKAIQQHVKTDMLRTEPQCENEPVYRSGEGQHRYVCKQL